MKIGFPYPGYEQIAPVELADANLLGVYEPRAVAHLKEPDLLARGFDKPFGAGPLRQEVRSTDRVLVLIDDLTRGTPIPRLLRRVFGELREAGVLDGRFNC